jgi:hypothetical protein
MAASDRDTRRQLIRIAAEAIGAIEQLDAVADRNATRREADEALFREKGASELIDKLMGLGGSKNEGYTECAVHPEDEKTFEAAKGPVSYRALNTDSVTYELPDEIHRGSRYTTLLGLARWLVNQQISFEHLTEELHRVNRSRCRPALSSDELKQIARKALGAGIKPASTGEHIEGLPVNW